MYRRGGPSRGPERGERGGERERAPRGGAGAAHDFPERSRDAGYGRRAGGPDGPAPPAGPGPMTPVPERGWGRRGRGGGGGGGGGQMPQSLPHPRGGRERSPPPHLARSERPNRRWGAGGAGGPGAMGPAGTNANATPVAGAGRRWEAEDRGRDRLSPRRSRSPPSRMTLQRPGRSPQRTPPSSPRSRERSASRSDSGRSARSARSGRSFSGRSGRESRSRSPAPRDQAGGEGRWGQGAAGGSAQAPPSGPARRAYGPGSGAPLPMLPNPRFGGVPPAGPGGLANAPLGPSGWRGRGRGRGGMRGAWGMPPFGRGGGAAGMPQPVVPPQLPTNDPPPRSLARKRDAGGMPISSEMLPLHIKRKEEKEESEEEGEVAEEGAFEEPAAPALDVVADAAATAAAAAASEEQTRQNEKEERREQEEKDEVARREADAQIKKQVARVQDQARAAAAQAAAQAQAQAAAEAQAQQQAQAAQAAAQAAQQAEQERRLAQQEAQRAAMQSQAAGSAYAQGMSVQRSGPMDESPDDKHGQGAPTGPRASIDAARGAGMMGTPQRSFGPGAIAGAAAVAGNTAGGPPGRLNFAGLNRTGSGASTPIAASMPNTPGTARGFGGRALPTPVPKSSYVGVDAALEAEIAAASTARLTSLFSLWSARAPLRAAQAELSDAEVEQYGAAMRAASTLAALDAARAEAEAKALEEDRRQETRSRAAERGVFV